MKIRLFILRLLGCLPRDVRLLIQTPREYLFSFTYPTNKFIRIYPYDSSVTKVGERLKKEIHNKFPELILYFHGSAALKIAGQRDVDIVIDCDPGKFEKYLPFMNTLLGGPEKRRKDFVQWRSSINNCSVETLLISSRNKLRNHLVWTFEKLKSDKKLLREYERMKLVGEGLSLREYDRLRMDFFNKVMWESK